MTEYDFSEEGYRRHLETQCRVSNWAHQTSRHVPANPFVPSETDPELRSDFYANASDSSSRLSLSSSGTARPKLRRSHTSPHRDTSRRHDHQRRDHHHSSTESNTNTDSLSSATTTTTNKTATTKPTRHRPSRSHTTDISSHSSRATATVTSGRAQPIRSQSAPFNYDIHHGGKHIKVPASKHGYTYVVIPKHGAPIKVVSPSPRSRIEYSTQSPTKKLSSPSQPQPPLLKRIFGSIITGASNSDARSSKSGSSRRTGVASGGKPRRSRRGSY